MFNIVATLIDACNFSCTGAIIHFVSDECLPQRMDVPCEVAMKLTGGLEPQGFIGLVSDCITEFPVPRYFRLSAADLTIDNTSRVDAEDRRQSVGGYILETLEAVFNFDARMWLSSGSIPCFAPFEALLYVMYRTATNNELFVKLGYRNHPKHEPLDKLIGYIEGKTQELLGKLNRTFNLLRIHKDPMGPCGAFWAHVGSYAPYWAHGAKSFPERFWVQKYFLTDV